MAKGQLEIQVVDKRVGGVPPPAQSGVTSTPGAPGSMPGPTGAAVSPAQSSSEQWRQSRQLSDDLGEVASKLDKLADALTTSFSRYTDDGGPLVEPRPSPSAPEGRGGRGGLPPQVPPEEEPDRLKISDVMEIFAPLLENVLGRMGFGGIATAVLTLVRKLEGMQEKQQIVPAELAEPPVRVPPVIEGVPGAEQFQQALRPDAVLGEVAGSAMDDRAVRDEPKNRDMRPFELVEQSAMVGAGRTGFGAGRTGFTVPPASLDATIPNVRDWLQTPGGTPQVVPPGFTPPTGGAVPPVRGGLPGVPAAGVTSGASLAGLGIAAGAIGIFALAVKKGSDSLGAFGAGLTAASPPLGLLAAGAKDVVDAFRSLGDDIEGVSGDVALARARTELNLEMARIRRGQRIGPDVARFEQTGGRIQELMYEIQTDIYDILLKISKPLLPILDKLLVPFMEFVSSKLDWLGLKFEGGMLVIEEAWQRLLGNAEEANELFKQWKKNHDRVIAAWEGREFADPDDPFTKAIMDMVMVGPNFDKDKFNKEAAAAGDPRRAGP